MNEKRNFVYCYSTPTYSYYYYTAAVFLARRRSCGLYTVVHSSTYMFVGTLVAIPPQGVTLANKKRNFVYYNTPPHSYTILLLYLLCAHPSLARRRSPAAALVGYTQQYTAVHFCWYISGSTTPGCDP